MLVTRMAWNVAVIAALLLPLTVWSAEEPVWEPLLLSTGAVECLEAGDADLGRIAEALRALPTAGTASGEVRQAQGVPFRVGATPIGVVLSSNRTDFTLPLGRPVGVLHILLALLTPGQELQAQCMVGRDDGLAIWLRYDSRINIGPSLGTWAGPARPQEEKPGVTRPVGTMQTRDGTEARLFHTAWTNDNPWYGVSRLRWKLSDPQARLVVLGVTTTKPKL